MVTVWICYITRGDWQALKTTCTHRLFASTDELKCKVHKTLGLFPADPVNVSRIDLNQSHFWAELFWAQSSEASEDRSETSWSRPTDPVDDRLKSLPWRRNWHHSLICFCSSNFQHMSCNSLHRWDLNRGNLDLKLFNGGGFRNLTNCAICNDIQD